MGLPEQWRHEPAGSYSVTGDRGSATGCFPARGAPRGLVQRDGGALCGTCCDDGDALALLHVDCDLYSSARDCLRSLAPLLQRGSVVLLFDDFLAHETWRDDEKRAWDEAIAENGLEVEVVAASLLSKLALLVRGGS